MSFDGSLRVRPEPGLRNFCFMHVVQNRCALLDDMHQKEPATVSGSGYE
ncbi:hypothetical protein [Mesorhizobium sp.]|nr:hypothetical protein [Mesorhizobium sp.]